MKMKLLMIYKKKIILIISLLFAELFLTGSDCIPSIDDVTIEPPSETHEKAGLSFEGTDNTYGWDSKADILHISIPNGEATEVLIHYSQGSENDSTSTPVYIRSRNGNFTIYCDNCDYYDGRYILGHSGNYNVTLTAVSNFSNYLSDNFDVMKENENQIIGDQVMNSIRVNIYQWNVKKNLPIYSVTDFNNSNTELKYDVPTGYDLVELVNKILKQAIVKFETIPNDKKYISYDKNLNGAFDIYEPMNVSNPELTEILSNVADKSIVYVHNLKLNYRSVESLYGTEMRYPTKGDHFITIEDVTPYIEYQDTLYYGNKNGTNVERLCVFPSGKQITFWVIDEYGMYLSDTLLKDHGADESLFVELAGISYGDLDNPSTAYLAVVTDNCNEVMKTLVHEIGHGGGGWDDLEKATDNLMYYRCNASTFLRYNQELTIAGKYEKQWDVAHDL